MSHELRTPLNAILGFSEILQDQMFGPLGSEKYHEYSRDIFESGKHLLNVINDILDMSKIEAGHMRITRERIDLAPLIEETLRFTTIPAERKNIRVVQQISSGLTMFADRRAMKQVLLNLLSNAVKFTNEGGRISLRARKVRGAVTLTMPIPASAFPRAHCRRSVSPSSRCRANMPRARGLRARARHIPFADAASRRDNEDPFGRECRHNHIGQDSRPRLTTPAYAAATTPWNIRRTAFERRRMSASRCVRSG